MPATTVAAVDFGATSIRVARVRLGDGPPHVEVVHRHPHSARLGDDGLLRWDWCRLVSEMEGGLRTALAPGDVASIGVDTWGVDYGLLDDRGCLLGAPISYRDPRTDGYGALVERLGAAHLYDTSGLQLAPFNTIFQLAAHDPAELRRARHVVLLPELLVHHLTGAVTAERTSAGCTGLLDLAAGTWSADLAESIGLPIDHLPEIHPAGVKAGSWQGVPVHLVGGHDTASAVAAAGSAETEGSAFASAGTWLLVGREQAEPDLSATARTAGFTNELGVESGVRFLRNLPGGWLLEQCRPQWGHVEAAELLATAATLPPGPTADLTDPALLHPLDMAAAIAGAAGLGASASPAAVTRCIVDSLAEGTAGVLAQLGDVTSLRLFGGLSRWALLRQRIAEVAGVAVHVGPVEATVLGNALVQGIALGVFEDLAHARQHLGLGARS